MPYHLNRMIALLFVFVALSASARAQEEPLYEELPNFHKVNDNLYRGGQPREGGMKRLAELGVKSIINLRGQDALTRRERKEAEAAGLRYFNVSMAGWGRPTDKQVAQVLALIDEPENWPIFVHCKRGSERTGMVMAVYRISHDGWTIGDANVEARRYGMSRLSIWIRDYISDYYRSYDRHSRAARANNSAQAYPEKPSGLDDKIGHFMTGLEVAASKAHFGIRWLFRKVYAH